MLAMNRRSLLLASVLFIQIYYGLAFTCSDGLTVIDDLNVCDFRDDCSDGGDESACPSTCSFEEGLCSWVQENETDTLDWIYWSNDSPDGYNGPAVDHTLNSVTGHYIYVDDANTTRDDYAAIRSPTFSQAARGCKFSFWYFVYGADMGTLKVFQYTPSDDRYYNLMRAVDAGDDPDTLNRWNFYEVAVAACAQNFKLSIEARDREDSEISGGYAIDDLRFEDCAYTLPLPDGGTCDATEEDTCDSGHCFPTSEICDFTLNCCDGTDESFSKCANYNMCDFEEGWCDWAQLTDDNFEWTRQKGTTGTFNTGPARDHTTASGEGYYIYTEANGAQPGDTYRIGSFYIMPTSSECQMRFYHHQQGMGIGTLNVHTRTQINGPLTLRYSTDQPHGDYWLYQVIPLSNTEAFQVIFEGVRGSSELGDIAVDDISFTPECVASTTPLPDAGATPTPAVNCPAGQRPCNEDTCLDEALFCDFRLDCSTGLEDEKYCPDFCNFDTDLCYWSQDFDDDFDWLWYDALDSDPGFKGPGTDHTSGTSQGHYIYVDGTSSRTNTRARLVSSVYKKSARGCTFSMWYYMFGVEYGDLEVRLKTLDGQNWRISKADDDLLDYNKWLLHEAVIPTCTTDFQIIIDAEDRQVIPSESGFAVDDILFSDCAMPLPVEMGQCGIGQAQCATGMCYPASQQCDFTQDCCDMSDEAPDTCSQLGYSTCDFETGLCGWTQLTSDEFDWTRDQGGTSTEQTGPSADHTSGTEEGYYIYTEASNPKRLGDRAKIASFAIQGTLSVCTMRFFYHMRGKGVGTLGVYTRTQINGPMSQVWFQDRTQGDQWNYDEVDFRSNDDFQIIIEGTIGTTVEGDIALDDISLTPDCAPTVSSLPTISTVPPSQIACSEGELPCNMGCISETKYCDFRHDCLPGAEDEMLCPVYCDFEDEHFCYWTQDQTDEFDWTLLDPHDNLDPTFKGPDKDHTSGSAVGHYIFVDGATSSLDQRAKLISPMYKKSASRGCIFSLWYYMFGVEYGDLEVRLVTMDGVDKRLTKASDDLDYNKWQQHITELPPCSTNFHIVIDAEDRQILPTEGGFAVDDLMFQDCEYPLPVADGACGVAMEQCLSGECYPASQQCDYTQDCCDNSDEDTDFCIRLGYSLLDFEQGLGEWQQLLSDEFDWTRESGGTSSDGTGPTSDHTTGTSEGFYIYTEASNPMRNGDRAQLGSFPISQTLTGLCSVRFFYNMRGIGIGTLNVYTRTAVNGPLTLIWWHDRAIGSLWVYETLALRSTDDFEIIFEGVIGYTTDGDIGLDDISLTPDCVRAESLPVVTTRAYSTSATTSGGIDRCVGDRFWCSPDNVCLDNAQKCDGMVDCSDGTDEIDCFASTSAGTTTFAPCVGDTFWCSADKVCLDNMKRCDVMIDCSDGTDEIDCPTSTVSTAAASTARKTTFAPCVGDTFLCSPDNVCLDNMLRCDAIVDCSDGTDETPCGKDNKGLVIGLSVTFSIIFVAAAAAAAFYIVRKQKTKTIENIGFTDSFSPSSYNPSYEKSSGTLSLNNAMEVGAFSVDRSDA